MAKNKDPYKEIYPEQRFVKSGAVARFFGVSYGTLQKWHNSGELKADFVSRGGKKYYDLKRIQDDIRRKYESS
jgi:hypothetical protein